MLWGGGSWCASSLTPGIRIWLSLAPDIRVWLEVLVHVLWKLVGQLLGHSAQPHTLAALVGRVHDAQPQTLAALHGDLWS